MITNSLSAQSQQPQVYTQQPDSAFTAEEEKPKIIKTISILFSLIAILYIKSTVATAGIIVMMDRTIGSGDSAFSFLKYFPTFGPIPILFSLAVVLFFFAALKIRNGSKFSFWLGIITLLVIPLPLGFLSQRLMSSLLSWAAVAIKVGTGENVPTIPFNPANLRFGDTILFIDPLLFILTFIALVLLIISFSKFHFVNEPLSKKAKIFLTLLFFILVLPTFLVVSLGYIKANDTDYGFTKAKSEVSYHVYKPTLAPEGLVNDTKFITNKEMAGKQNAVQVIYNVPFTELPKAISEGKLQPIILKQVGVEPGFDLQSYASTVIKDFSSLQPMSLPIAKNQSAFLIEREVSDSGLIYIVLTYVTHDDVLISIASPYTTKGRLLQFAESLQ